MTFYNQLNHLPRVMEDPKADPNKMIELFDDIKYYKGNESVLDQIEMKKMANLLSNIN